MATTLDAIVREMLALEPTLGRIDAIASLTTLTAVITALATGTVSSGKYGGKWMKRPETATAGDRVRLSTEAGFASATGTLTHAGAIYGDTTATSEELELLEHEPRLFDEAVQKAINQTRRLDTSMLPTRNAIERYWMHDLSWVAEPSDLWRVYRTANPVLSRNRHMEKWNTVSSGGVLQPDHWTLSGASATMARSTTGVRQGQYSVAVTRAGTNALLSQTVGLLETEVSADSLRGETVQGVLVGQSSVAASLEVEVTDGVTTTTSSTMTGDNTVREISTAAHVISSTATTLTVRARVKVDETAYIDQLYLCFGALNDAIRRDHYPLLWEAVPAWEQGASTLQLYLPAQAPGGQYLVETWRPYPQFDATRVIAGSADADVSDVPVGIAARGALHFLYAGLPKTPDYEDKAAKWGAAFAQARAQHMLSQRTQRTGLPVLSGPSQPVPSRPY